MTYNHLSPASAYFSSTLTNVSSVAAPRAPKTTRGRGGRGRGAKATGAGRSHRPKKTVEELDAEMSDYYSAANPAV